MVVFTAKFTKRRIVAFFLALGIITCSAVVIARNVNEQENPEAETETLNTEVKSVKTNEDRLNVLSSYGWEVEAEPIEFMEVRIPEEFDGVYKEYAELQMKQGLDMAPYAGKRAMKYTYKVKNHPNSSDGVVANIIICRNKLIAGDVSSPKLGGFMQGLVKSEEPVV